MVGFRQPNIHHFREMSHMNKHQLITRLISLPNENTYMHIEEGNKKIVEVWCFSMVLWQRKVPFTVKKIKCLDDMIPNEK